MGVSLTEQGVYEIGANIVEDISGITANTTDNYSFGTPVLYRCFNPDNAGNHKIQIWPAPDSGFLAQCSSQLLYSYWQQLTQLSGDNEVPAVPYELDNIFEDGGSLYMAKKQGDNILMAMYKGEYEQRKGELRAWLIDQFGEDYTLKPEQPLSATAQPGIKADYGNAYY